MAVIKVIVDMMPESCITCTLHDGVYVSDEGEGKPTMYAVDCPVADGATMDWECGYATRPDWCPLVAKTQLMEIVVRPEYDNAWEFIQRLFAFMKESEVE